MLYCFCSGIANFSFKHNMHRFLAALYDWCIPRISHDISILSCGGDLGHIGASKLICKVNWWAGSCVMQFLLKCCSELTMILIGVGVQNILTFWNCVWYAELSQGWDVFSVVENAETQDTSQRPQGKFFLSFPCTLFSYFLDLKNYKLRSLRSDPGSLHFPLLSFLQYLNNYLGPTI